MKILDRLEEYLIAFLMALATLITFTAVVHRYLSGLPIPHVQDYLISLNFSWAQEVTIFLFIWMAKFGAAYGVRSGIHVGVDVLVNRLSPQYQKLCVLISVLAGALFTGIIAYLGGEMTINSYKGQMTSEAIELPLWIVYLVIPIASSLMSFRFLQVGWRYLKTGELPKHDHSHVDGLESEVTP